MSRKNPLESGQGSAPKNPRNFKSLVRRAGFPPLAFEGKATTYDERTREVLDQDTKDLDARTNPTVIDLRSLPSDASDTKILEWTAKWLKVGLSDLKAEGATDRSKELYKKLNQSLLMAADYMRGTLQLGRQLDHMFPDGAYPILRTSDDLTALLRFILNRTRLDSRPMPCIAVSFRSRLQHSTVSSTTLKT